MEIVATAPGKLILFGEHAVVHGQPAIAVPFPALEARAVAGPNPEGPGLYIIAANLGRTLVVRAEPADDEPALCIAARLVLDDLGVPPPDLQILLSSTIPIAGGFGSGAAATTALLRALSVAVGQPLALEKLNAHVYEIEKLYHGTPSGIDNTVIVYGQPVYFVRGQPIETFAIGAPLHFVVADTGIQAPTHETVGDVRKLYHAEPERVGAIFARIGRIAEAARAAIEQGDVLTLGPLMQENHTLLRELTVSSTLLDNLAAAALGAGAWGAKLSGGGRGGNLITLVPPGATDDVIRALEAAGARRTFETTIA